MRLSPIYHQGSGQNSRYKNRAEDQYQNQHYVRRKLSHLPYGVSQSLESDEYYQQKQQQVYPVYQSMDALPYDQSYNNNSSPMNDDYPYKYRGSQSIQKMHSREILKPSYTRSIRHSKRWHDSLQADQERHREARKLRKREQGIYHSLEVSPKQQHSQQQVGQFKEYGRSNLIQSSVRRKQLPPKPPVYLQKYRSSPTEYYQPVHHSLSVTPYNQGSPPFEVVISDSTNGDQHQFQKHERLIPVNNYYKDNFQRKNLTINIDGKNSESLLSRSQNELESVCQELSRVACEVNQVNEHENRNEISKAQKIAQLLGEGLIWQEKGNQALEKFEQKTKEFDLEEQEVQKKRMEVEILEQELMQLHRHQQAQNKQITEMKMKFNNSPKQEQITQQKNLCVDLERQNYEMRIKLQKLCQFNGWQGNQGNLKSKTAQAKLDEYFEVQEQVQQQKQLFKELKQEQKELFDEKKELTNNIISAKNERREYGQSRNNQFLGRSRSQGTEEHPIIQEQNKKVKKMDSQIQSNSKEIQYQRQQRQQLKIYGKSITQPRSLRLSNLENERLNLEAELAENTQGLKMYDQQLKKLTRQMNDASNLLVERRKDDEPVFPRIETDYMTDENQTVKDSAEQEFKQYQAQIQPFTSSFGTEPIQNSSNSPEINQNSFEQKIDDSTEGIVDNISQNSDTNPLGLVKSSQKVPNYRQEQEFNLGNRDFIKPSTTETDLITDPSVDEARQKINNESEFEAPRSKSPPLTLSGNLYSDDSKQINLLENQNNSHVHIHYQEDEPEDDSMNDRMPISHELKNQIDEIDSIGQNYEDSNDFLNQKSFELNKFPQLNLLANPAISNVNNRKTGPKVMIYKDLATGTPVLNSADFDVEPIYNGAGFEVIPTLTADKTLDLMDTFEYEPFRFAQGKEGQQQLQLFWKTFLTKLQDIIEKKYSWEVQVLHRKNIGQMTLYLMKNSQWLKFYKPKGQKWNSQASLIFALQKPESARNPNVTEESVPVFMFFKDALKIEQI